MAELRVDQAEAVPGGGDAPSPGQAAQPASSAERRAASQLPSQAQRRRGHRERPSKLRGVRLLWEEEGFGIVGVFCVAALALAVTWFVLEGMFQLNGAFSGLVAVATAVATLEGISRRHYAHLQRPASLKRVTSARGQQRPFAGRRDELAARRRAA